MSLFILGRTLRIKSCRLHFKEQRDKLWVVCHRCQGEDHYWLQDPQNAKPVGQWNKVTVMVCRGTVVHKMNGENLVEYLLWTDNWKDMVEKSKFEGMEDFINTGLADQKGYIDLQDHGDSFWFKNTKI